MHGDGRRRRERIGAWSLVLLVGMGEILSLGPRPASAEQSEKARHAAVDSTQMHGHEMEPGEPTARQAERSFGQQSEEERGIKYWTCGMHPSVRADSPGKCPICGMNLVAVYEEGAQAEGAEVRVELTAREMELADVRTDVVTYRSLHKSIRAVGTVVFDERKLARVAAWVGGRVDRLFVDFTGAQVSPGQPMLEIYSPSLVTTQQEYLLALETLEKVQHSRIPETALGARSLVEAARKRLLLWGVSERQIVELERDREARTHVTVHAPLGGTVINKAVKEGMYVKEGQVLFDIADLSTMWVIAQIYESELSWIEVGQKVTIGVEGYPGETFTGRVTFVDPFLNPKTRTVGVRIEVANEAMKLKAEMFADAAIRVPTGRILAVPRTAVLDTGPRKIAYLDEGGGRFVGVEVEVGAEAEGFYPVLSGLSDGDTVVTAANFLIDSQTQLLTGASALYGGAKEVKEAGTPPPGAGHQH